MNKREFEEKVCWVPKSGWSNGYFRPKGYFDLLPLSIIEKNGYRIATEEETEVYIKMSKLNDERLELLKKNTDTGHHWNIIDRGDD